MPAPLKHDFPFDPTYGYDEAAMRRLAPPPPPADFADFWRKTYDENSRIPLKIERRPIDSPSSVYEWHEIEFNSWGDFRVGGWLLLPRNGRVTCGFVVGHGYGGRGAPDINLPVADAAAIFPCARGFQRSARADTPGVAAQHVVVGIDSRETYIHRGCAAELWSAASALIEVVPQAAKQLYYIGGSFGGGMGALALPWDRRFKKAQLGVPSFGNHPLRLTIPCVGSGESVRLYYQKHPEIAEVLKYYDTASSATFINIPMLVDCALFDPAVPPPGQFTVYNAIPSEKELIVMRAGHFDYPEAVAEGARKWRRMEEFFALSAS